MLHRQLTICFFVGYLGLLLNLGPSLHHAPIFGLHSHNHSSHGTKSVCHSCCGHSHADYRQPEQDSNVDSVASTNDNHDCSFCKFFDQYHVIVDRVETVEASGFAEIREAVIAVDPFAVSLVPLARGPPILA